MKKKVRKRKKRAPADSDIGAEDVGTEKEKPLTADHQLWLEQDDVKRALAIVRESSRSQLDAIHPAHNLELDLGLDSMQRIELLTALEQQLGGEVPESQLAEIYSVRDLIDAILASAGRGEGQARTAEPAWSTILSEAVTDPEGLALANLNIFADIPFFLLGRLVLLFSLDPFRPKMLGLTNLPHKAPF